MKRLLYLPIVVMGLVLAACSGPAAGTADPSAKSGTYRFAFSGEMNVRDVPLLMALDALEAQGYTVELINLAEADLVPEAMVRGDADLGSFSVRNTWPVIAEGADLRAIASSWVSTFAIVAKTGIGNCADLDGIGVAFSGARGINQILLQKHIEQNCPGSAPEILALGNSGARTAALLAGEIEAAQLETENILELERDAPGQFHTLVNFGQEFPEVFVSTFGVRREWADAHPEMIRDFLKALLLAQRAVNDDPALLPAELVSRLSYEPDAANELAAAYLNPGIWYLNGGFTTDSIQFNIDLLVETGDLNPGVKIADIVDLSYLNAVLDEIGSR